MLKSFDFFNENWTLINVLKQVCILIFPSGVFIVIYLFSDLDTFSDLENFSEVCFSLILQTLISFLYGLKLGHVHIHPRMTVVSLGLFWIASFPDLPVKQSVSFY